MSELTSTEKKRRFYMFAALGVGVAAVILIASFMLFTPKKQENPSSLAATRTDLVKGGAGGQGSEEYNRKLAEQSERQANSALQTGESYIPPPTGRRLLVAKKEDTPPPPKPAPVPTPRVAPVRQPRENNEMLKRMMDDLNALDTQLRAYSVGQGAIAYQYDFSKDKQVKVEKTAATGGGNSSGKQDALDLQIGDLLYAVVDIGVNSDVPSAVMATVTAGKYKKTRLIGKFQRHDERLVLMFNRAILPGGGQAQIEAYAVDPNTTEGSVASSVDTHFFERWGGLIAAAFLEGLGDAKRYSGAQSTMYGGYGGYGVEDRMVWGNYSVEDQAWIAAGKVGEKASRIFERGFDRPPTVYLAAGSPIGVLVMNVKENQRNK